MYLSVLYGFGSLAVPKAWTILCTHSKKRPLAASKTTVFYSVFGTLVVVSAPRCPSASISRSPNSPNLAVAAARSSTTTIITTTGTATASIPLLLFLPLARTRCQEYHLFTASAVGNCFVISCKCAARPVVFSPNTSAPARGGITQRGGASRGSAPVFIGSR